MSNADTTESIVITPFSSNVIFKLIFTNLNKTVKMVPYKNVDFKHLFLIEPKMSDVSFENSRVNGTTTDYIIK